MSHMDQTVIDRLDLEPLELPGGPPLSDTLDDVRADRL